MLELASSSIKNIICYAQKSYPAEACGFILQSGLIYPALNVIENLNNISLNRKNAFLIDDISWKIASAQQSPIIGIYHSHNNGNANMSEYDKNFLRWKNLYYVIIGLKDYHPTELKAHWWDNDILQSQSIVMPF